ncbi:MAG: ChbG/HpnK family deacetylase [bacterium]
MRINADDYGLHADINHGIIKCLRSRLINSVSIAVCGRACKQADIDALLTIQQDNPSIQFSIHLMATGGMALSGRTSLTNQQGCFPHYISDFLKRYIRGRISIKELEREWELQITTLRKFGVGPTRLDSHQHVHLIPGIWNLAKRLAEKNSIPSIRCGYESVMGAFAKHDIQFIILQVLSLYRYITTSDADKTLGILCSCDFALEKVEKSIPVLCKKKKKAEIMVHPGMETEELKKSYSDWNAHWQQEMRELERLKKYLEFLGNKP